MVLYNLHMYKFAIIGVGGIGKTHLKAILNDRRCTVSALCSRTISKCYDLKKEFSLPDDITVTDDWKNLLKRNDIDAAAIALPPALHREVTIAFLENGKHVILEKPMALTLEEEDEMLEAQRKSGKKLGLIFQNRYYTSVQKAKKMLDDGTFGKILSIDVTSHWFRGVNYHNLYWRGTWESEGGGTLTAQGIHQVDMLLWLMGGQAENISAVMRNMRHTNSEAEDMGFAFISFPSALASFSVSLNDMNEYQGFRIQCEKASITLPEWSVHVAKPQPNGYPERDEAEEKRFQDIYDSIPPLEKEGHDEAFSRFIDAVEEGKEPEVDGLDGRRATEFVDAFYLSAATGKTVSFPLGKDSPVYTKEGLVKTMPKYFSKTVSTEAQSGSISLGSAAK